jgi:DNA-binding transcriptional LysR family regulator
MTNRDHSLSTPPAPSSAQLLPLDLLRTLVAIADCGGFAKAADAVYLTQSAVSLQVARLEELVDQPLFEKVGRQQRLTPAGEELTTYARRIIALSLEASAALKGRLIDGTLSLAAPQDVAEDVLPNILRQFAAQFPRVQLQVTIERNRHLLQAIDQSAFDVVLLMAEAKPAASAQRLQQAKVEWIAGKQFDLTRVQDEALPLALLEPPCVFRAMATTELEASKVRYRVSYNTASLAGLRAALSAGLGISARVITAQDEAMGIRALKKSELASLGLPLPSLKRMQTWMWVKPGASAAAVEIARLLKATYKD